VIFYVVLAIVVILVLADIFYFEDGLFSFISIFAGAIVIGIVSLVAVGTPTVSEEVRRETHTLRALDTRESSASYRFYLSSGYNNGQPGFNYLREEGDATVMRFAQNWQARVYEDNPETPSVDVIYYHGYNTILVPWPSRDFWNVEFHVPEGSVSNEIQVTP
jgi:hypothetical protein